jgi:hypothetical protein
VIELAPGGPPIDPVAVYLAITGTRLVELSRAEKLIAAALILAGGGRQADVTTRLRISKAEVSRMRARLRATIDAGHEDAA